MCASLADWFVLWAVLWSAELLGWSGSLTAGVLLAARVPALFGGTLGGVAVDRFGPGRMLVVDGAVRTAVAAGLVANGLWNDFGYAVALVLIAVAGTAAPVSYSGVRTFLPRVVPDADLGAANTLLAVGNAMPLVLSAGLVGPALTWFGLAWSFAVPGVLMVLVVLIALRYLGGHAVVGPPGSAVEVHSRVGRLWLDEETGAAGWRRGVPVAAPALLGLSTAYFFCFGPFDPALPVIVRDQLGADVQTYGLLWSLAGVGCLAGLLVAPALCRLPRPAVVNVALVVLNGVAMLVVALAPNVAAAVFGCVAIGLLWTPYAAVEATALQRLTPRRIHGRVFGLQRALVISALPLGAALGAMAQDRYGASPTLAVAGLVSMVVALAALLVPAIHTEVHVTVSEPSERAA
jgi:MFS family permease